MILELEFFEEKKTSKNILLNFMDKRFKKLAEQN